MWKSPVLPYTPGIYGLYRLQLGCTINIKQEDEVAVVFILAFLTDLLICNDAKTYPKF